MRSISSIAIVAVGLFCCSPSNAQQSFYDPAGAIVLGPPVGALWAGPVVRDSFEANPLDDGYDYPFGYGEYAAYGRWGVDLRCYRLRRHVLTSVGYRWRTIRRCN